MDKQNTKQIAGLKELYNLIDKALNKSQQLSTTSKSATLQRMLGVIEFEHFKLTGASILDEEGETKEHTDGKSLKSAEPQTKSQEPAKK